MERNFYLPPESKVTLIATEQGICYSSGEDANYASRAVHVDVEEYDKIENDVTFD